MNILGNILVVLVFACTLWMFHSFGMGPKHIINHTFHGKFGYLFAFLAVNLVIIYFLMALLEKVKL